MNIKKSSDATIDDTGLFDFATSAEIATAKLTAKQQRFCEEYVVDMNATQAAIRAGYSKNSASVIGSENLGKPNVVQCIAELKKALSESTAIRAERVLEEIASIAFSTPKAVSYTHLTLPTKA